MILCKLLDMQIVRYLHDIVYYRNSPLSQKFNIEKKLMSNYFLCGRGGEAIYQMFCSDEQEPLEVWHYIMK